MRIVRFARLRVTDNDAGGMTYASVAAVKISFTWYTKSSHFRHYINDEIKMINFLNYYI